MSVTYKLGIATELTPEEALKQLIANIHYETIVEQSSIGPILHTLGWPFSFSVYKPLITANPSYDFWVEQMHVLPTVKIIFDDFRGFPRPDRAKDNLLQTLLNFLDEVPGDAAFYYHDLILGRWSDQISIRKENGFWTPERLDIAKSRYGETIIWF